jgi:mRNA interferase RelE/StbE
VTGPRRLRVPPEVVALLRGMHPELKRRARDGLDRGLADPSVGKALRAELEGLRSRRIGGMRVIYRESGVVVEVVAAGPRNRIYEETLRLVRRQQRPRLQVPPRSRRAGSGNGRQVGLPVEY